ncbi:MAG: chromate transporter [Clostridia bacterium]|nr:chromate transporter [Clostridia bacterium]
MNILLDLFLTFLKIGAVSFGGGYGMLALIREECLTHAWLTEEQLLNFIAVSESTPGPIAVNLATFIGSSQAGFPGALLATLGVILPAFCILLLVSALLGNFLKKPAVQGVLSGVRPAVVGLILGTGVTLFLSVVCGLSGGVFHFDWRSLLVFGLVAAVGIGLPLLPALKKKNFKLSPILLILFSALLGVLLWGK